MSSQFGYFPPDTNKRNHPAFILSRAVKRLFDILVSFLCLVFLSPFFALIGWMIKRDSPGPVFYRGPRKGKDNGTFLILKFRTMREVPESYTGPRITAQDDPRISAIGKKLRDTKLNELPQLWNVLKGDMSLVGPRPEDPEIVAKWTEDVRREVLSVQPGITSPASVLFRNEESLLNHQDVIDTYLVNILPGKLRLDQLYVRNRSFWLDLDVLMLTFWALMLRSRSVKIQEQHLMLGPISIFARRFLNWFIIDSLIAFVSIGLVGLLWRSKGPLDVGWWESLGVALGFAMVFSAIGALLGVQRVEWSKAAASDAFDLILPVSLATGISYTVNHYTHLFPDNLILLAAALSCIGFILARYRIRVLTGLTWRLFNLQKGARIARERVLIVGCGETGQFATWMLLHGQISSTFNVVGYVDDDLYKKDSRIHGIRVLGQRKDIPGLVSKYDIGVIVYAIHNITPEERQKLLKICRGTGAKVIMGPSFVYNLQKSFGLDESGLEQVNAEWESTASRFSKADFETWLNGLDMAAKKGDLKAIRKEIKIIRDRISVWTREK